MPTDILTGLNPEQAAAVTHKKGPLLIVAGAGTGKTTVITRRIAWLIAEKLAKPGEILALTFTDKAASEMEARVDMLVPYGYIDVSISTFHAFGDRILRDHALDLGLRPDYRVLSRAEQVVFFREHLFDFPLKHFLSLGDPTKHIEALIGVISRAKDEDITPEEYVEWAEAKGRHQGIKGSRAVKTSIPRSLDPSLEFEKQLEIALVYKKYQEFKAQKGFLDFGDQVSLTLKLFRQHPDILKELRNRYKYILVDEFQDTNFAQFEQLKLLAPKKANVTVVADDDQAIYRFRGAAVNNVLGFEGHYKQSRKIVLTRNYRSTQLILDTSRRLIKHNDPERLEVKAGIDKRLVAESKEAGQPVQHLHFDTASSEADWVARTIKEKFDAGNYKYRDFAILTRSNADAELFRQSLNMLSIPFVFSGGGGLYVHSEVRLAVSFLRVIGDLTDSKALYHLVVSDLYQLDPLDLQKLNTFASRRNYTLHHVFANLEKAGVPSSGFEVLSDIGEKSRKVAARLMGDINYYVDFAKDKTTGEVLYQFLKKSGYLAGLTKVQSQENEGRIRNLAKFFDKVREFKEVADHDRVSEFVKYLNILKEAGDDPESSQPDIDADAVSLLTVHKSKGLEFPVVFMVSLVADKFPVRNRRQPLDLPDGVLKEKLPASDLHVMEERRLFYVGMTRAKKELYLTSAVDYGGKRDRKVSQFVLEALDLPKADLSVVKRPPLNQLELFAPKAETPIPERVYAPDELVQLSHYQIDDYLTCPQKYKFVHLLRVPLLPNQQIIYGSALHKAVQAFFTAKKHGQKFGEKELLEVFTHNWSPEG
ncbi:MAG: ATP-dependent helicase, partial [Candidatus Margulisbacteria bacterium]|nr:ATP-dependent helicase [Candidatus Margulisiibacteriota bacterium]